MKIFKNKLVAIDSMILIYLLEGHKIYANLVAEIFNTANKFLLSSLVCGEILTGLYKKKDQKAINQFLLFVQGSPKIIVKDFSTSMAIKFAQLRSLHPKLSPPDSIHLACALEGGADIFLTNDSAIKNIEGLKIVQLKEC